MPSTPEDIRSQILALVKEYHQAKFTPKTFDPDKDMVPFWTLLGTIPFRRFAKSWST